MRALLAVGLLAACSPKTTPLEPGEPKELEAFPVDSDREGAATRVTFGACPTEREPIAGKLRHAEYVDAHPAETHLVNVMLRSRGLPEDDLHARMLANQQQVACVISGLTRVTADATWYEEPRFFSDGLPAPVGLGFTVALSATQVKTMAAHPFVWRIEPAFGEALRLGLTAPYPPEGCPSEAEAGDAKIADARSIENRGRRPVLIELKHGGLPSDVRARTIVNTRHVTCVKRALERVQGQWTAPVAYGSGSGNPMIVLPPFGQSAAVVKTVGAGLTWPEVQRMAEHPYVERIWTFDGLVFDEAQPGCPPDLTKPVPAVTCPQVTEAIDAKLSESDRNRWSAADATEPQSVTVLVAGGAQICSLPQCPPPPAACDERDRLTERWRAENTEAQRCVRDAITAAGGTADTEVFWLVNVVSAQLTWAQIQAVAAHPHVLQIEGGGEAPPSR